MINLYRTDEGLFLEDEELLIPWGTPLEPGGIPGNREVQDADGQIWAIWRQRRAFGALVGDVVTGRKRPQTGGSIPDVRPHLPIFFPEFCPGLQSFHLSVPADGRKGRVFLRLIHDRLEEFVGPASWCYPRYHRGLPSIHWEGDKIEYSCALHGSSLGISVTRIPDDTPEQTAKWYAARRDIRDDRVPFVVWDDMDSRLLEARFRHKGQS